SNDGPVRVRGGAGTGKTVVALHRARRLATTETGRVLLTTFVTTLPKAWQGLFETFAPLERARIDICTVDAVAYDIYRAGGGWALLPGVPRPLGRRGKVRLARDPRGGVAHASDRRRPAALRRRDRRRDSRPHRGIGPAPVRLGGRGRPPGRHVCGRRTAVHL